MRCDQTHEINMQIWFWQKILFFLILFYNFVTENIFYLISLYPQEQAFFW